MQNLNNNKLQGKSCIVTGAASGIGLATTKLFVAQGAKVLMVDLNAALLEKEAKALGDAVDFCVADVSNPAQVEAYVEQAVAKFGKLDVLFANAGIEGAVAAIGEYPVEKFDQIMAINVRGPWLAIKYAFKHMQQNGGSIIITSSTGGIKGAPNFSGYVTSKHATIGLMRAAAVEGAAYKIRVNTVNPAPVSTPMITAIEQSNAKNGKTEADIAAAFTKQIPLGRYAQADEIANLVAFLASDDSQFITGGVYMIDGGKSAT